MAALEHLFSPIRIKGLTLANRAVMPAMGTGLSEEGGWVGEALLAYFRRQASSGAGLIFTEVTAVHEAGMSSPSQLSAWDDRFIPGLKRLAETIHGAGGKAAVQLHHPGRESGWLLSQGRAVSASATPSAVHRKAGREMTLAEIEEMVRAFGSAAVRAREAGFDAVEVHGAHGYLLAQFLSPRSNVRQDAYGGSLENRARFILEILAEVRRRVGDDFPISLRVSAEEAIKNGYMVEDVQKLAPAFVRAGADIIHASIGTHGSPGGITSASAELEPGFNAWRARKIKEVVDVPVIAVGRFQDPALAEEVIGRGDADLVAFGRQQLADPDFLIKARSGRSREIRCCLSCNQGCIERLMLNEGTIRCAINPETGQELAYPQAPARKPRRVLIVGAGPAGLVAACEAARLGHSVALYERQETAGGTVKLAGLGPFKEGYLAWIAWLFERVKEAGVEVHLGRAATAETLARENPEAVILASGAEAAPLAAAWAADPKVVQADDVLLGRVPPGKDVVVVGAGWTGMETSDFLLAKGSRVTVVEALDRSPVISFTAHGYWLNRRFRNASGRQLFETEIQAVGENEVTVRHKGEAVVLTPVDQVAMAVGRRPCLELEKALRESGLKYTVVGDARGARRIIEAVEEGARAAWEL
jgi:2,4-dienoyl-CoA reductase-like NADH-dependent reductase (Old Yellow Enzyme family)/thioredoxin reductase